jgi:hypothetical protein
LRLDIVGEGLIIDVDRVIAQLGQTSPQRVIAQSAGPAKHAQYCSCSVVHGVARHLRRAAFGIHDAATATKTAASRTLFTSTNEGSVCGIIIDADGIPEL